MRSKSRNVQQPPRRSPRKAIAASSRALPVLITQIDNPTKTVFETSSDSYGVEKDSPSIHQMVGNIDEDMALDSLGLGSCIRCVDRDGLLLVCAGRDCLICVHVKCMGCDPKFDDSGKFRCPFCEQKLAVAWVAETRMKVMEAKKALSNFLEGKSVTKNEEKDVGDIEVENRITGMAGDRKKRAGNDLLGNVTLPNSSVVNDVDGVGSSGEGTRLRADSVKEIGQLEAVEEEENEKAEESGSSREREGEDIAEENRSMEEDEEEIQQEASEEIENDSEVSENDKPVNRPKRFKRRAGKTENLKKGTRVREPFLRRKSVAKKNASTVYEKATRSKSQAANTISIANFPREKRKRLHWTAEEEEMLSICVDKYSEGAINIPWRKILDDGSAVFHKTRVPGDLKEKWRNMKRPKKQ